MKSTLSILSCATAFVSIACAPGETQDSVRLAARTETAEAFVERWEQAVHSSDRAFLASFHPALPADRQEMYLMLMQSMLTKFEQVDGDNLLMIDCESDQGDADVCFVRYHFDSEDDSQAFAFSITKHDGSWKYYEE